jgi:hypothetical protein
MADGRSTLDLFGRGWVLLRTTGASAEDARLLEAARALGLPLVIEDLAEPAIRELYAAPRVLVRPDGHVAWRGPAVPADAAALLDTARGR